MRHYWRFVLDADNGELKNPVLCALAWDLRETYPELQRPHVDKDGIAFTEPDTDTRLTWKPEAIKKDKGTQFVRWIEDFDNGMYPEDLSVTVYRTKARAEGPERHEKPRAEAQAKKKDPPLIGPKSEPKPRRR
jgi:hypothetical protein